jgi:hypothetical protein
MENCSKCLTPCDDPIKYTDLHECWNLCVTCHRFFDCQISWLREFLEEDFGEFPISQVGKNIIDARKKRAEGNSPWKI